MTRDATDPANTSRFRPELAVILFLCLATAAVYWNVQGHDFIYLDDDQYVIDNPHVQKGLTMEGLLWALQTRDVAYWHPLTWLSLMLDRQFFGPGPTGFHAMNLVLHMANAVLVFLALHAMTGALWQSALVAALFALHPLNVESVAWVSERKNVLSAFFGLWTILLYVRFTRCPGGTRYLLCLLCFALGLLAKPILVTIPFVLLLLDHWPLERTPLSNARHPSGLRWEGGKQPFQWAGWTRLILEKVPLILLSLISVAISSVSVKLSGYVVSDQFVPMGQRVANALYSYMAYPAKLFWPSGLSVFYPPRPISIAHAVLAAMGLAAVTVLVFRSLRNRPYLLVGWLWFLGTLLPVIGLVRVGLWPAMADRFVYLPQIGFFVMIVWGVSCHSSGRLGAERRLVIIATALIVSAYGLCTGLQVGHWQNSLTLFKRALAVTEDNHLANNAVGNALARAGAVDQAVPFYQEALRIIPLSYGAHNNLGIALAAQGRYKEATHHFRRAASIKPDYAPAYYNLGDCLLKQDLIQEAAKAYAQALRESPDFAQAHNGLGLALIRLGDPGKAVSHFRDALAIAPSYREARQNLERARSRLAPPVQASPLNNNPSHL